MKIGIYKPYKKVYFHDDTADLNAISYEVEVVAKIFHKFGHEVYMLSDNDLTINDEIKNGTLNEQYDRILLFSGTFVKDVNNYNIIRILRNLTTRLDFLLTDLRLTPDTYEFFDNVYTQATTPLNIGVHNTYGGIAELRCFEKFKSYLNEEKTIEYYFGGTERGRLIDYLEYVWRPDCMLTTKSDTLNINTRITRDEYLNNLKHTKYSIVIADEEYNKQHFITPRHYENILNGIISFVDRKFDPDCHLIQHTDFCRVESYLELKQKMMLLNNNTELYLDILSAQQKIIKPEYVDGSYVYNLLK